MSSGTDSKGGHALQHSHQATSSSTSPGTGTALSAGIRVSSAYPPPSTCAHATRSPTEMSSTSEPMSVTVPAPVGPGYERQIVVGPRALVDVDEVHAARGHVHPHVAWRRRLRGEVHDFQDLGSSGLIDDYGTHRLSFVCGGVARGGLTPLG